jgi:hypothetical protein
MRHLAIACAVFWLGCNRANLTALGEREEPDEFHGGRDAAVVSDYSVVDFCADLRSAWVERCQLWKRDDCDSAADAMFGAQVCPATARAVAAGRVRYDAARAQQCVERRAFDLASAWQSGWVGAMLCDGMFAGTAPLDQSCYPDETFQRVCDEGFCLRDEQCPGVCTQYAAAGGHCVPERCGPGYYCSADNRCLSQLGPGQACPDGWGCALPATCVGGTCVVLADVGQSCSEETPCVYPLLCAKGQCVTEVSPGQPCEMDRHCPEGYACGFVPLGGSARACVERPGPGEPCDRRVGCAQGARCASDGSPLLGTCENDAEAVAPEPEPEPIVQPQRPPLCHGD